MMKNHTQPLRSAMKPAPEVMFYARSMVTSSFQTTLIYATAAGLYLALGLPLMQAVRLLERRVGRLSA